MILDFVLLIVVTLGVFMSGFSLGAIHILTTDCRKIMDEWGDTIRMWKESSRSYQKRIRDIHHHYQQKIAAIEKYHGGRL